MLLEDLSRVFGGRIRRLGERRWLDTRVSGLRTFVVPRVDGEGRSTFDLAVFTPQTRELDPFFSRQDGEEWFLDDARVVPPLSGGYLCSGCHRGILFASNMGETSLENIVGALWELARWAREPWHPRRRAQQYSGSTPGEGWRERVLRLTWVVLIVALVLWLRDEAVAERAC